MLPYWDMFVRTPDITARAVVQRHEYAIELMPPKGPTSRKH